MAPGYWWAWTRALSIEGWEIVQVTEYGEVLRCGDDRGYDESEFEFGPRVKGQDADSEA